MPVDMNLEWPLKSFTVPHIYSLPGQTWIRQLIVFSDASEDTCAAAAYLRAIDGETVCHLLMAKTRFMPSKTISIL